MPDPSPRNRRERRASAKKAGQPFEPLSTAADIPMAIPDFTRSTEVKTLLDLAAERQALLDRGQPFSPVHGDGLVRDEKGRVVLPPKKGRDVAETETEVEQQDPPIGPLGEALFLTTTLAVLHLTLNVLVHNQYGHQAPTLLPLVWQTLGAAPLLFVAVYALKLPEVARREAVKQVLHFVIGTVAGCWLIYIGNRESYMDVMARAPSVAAVVIWSVIEMKLTWGLVSLGICGGYVWWNGFSLM